MQKIIYTVCSANHLAFAKTMVTSFLQHHPDYKVFICLTDKVAARFDVNNLLPATIIEVGELGINELPEMSERYSLIEFNCAVKPFMATYLINKYFPETIIYADSDLFFYNRIAAVETALFNHNIALTPHITAPYSDDATPMERDMLRSGIYNAGFIGMKVTKETIRFLNWWAERMKTQCYYNFELGLAVDQNWLNLVPLFFKDVHVLFDRSLNVAYWNLHERTLSKNDEAFFVNGDIPLIFFHFSGYKLDAPDLISRHQNRFDMNSNPAIKQLFSNYREAVLSNGYEDYFPLKSHYAKPAKKSSGLMATANRFLKVAGIELKKAR